MVMRKSTQIKKEVISDWINSAKKIWWKVMASGVLWTILTVSSAATLAVVNTWCWTNPNTLYENESEKKYFELYNWESKKLNFELAPWNYTMTVYLSEWNPALFVNISDDFWKLQEQVYIDENFWKIEIVPIYNNNGYINLEVNIFNQEYYQEYYQDYVKWYVEIKWDKSYKDNRN